MATFLFILRGLLAGVFLLSSVSKCASPRRFVSSVANYRILPPALAHWYGWFLIFFELLLGAGLLVGWQTRWFAIGAAFVLVTFIAAVAVVFIRKQDADCSCFGLLYREKVGYATLLRDLLLFALAVWVALAAGSVPSLSVALTRSSIVTRAAGFVLLGILVSLLGLAAWRALTNVREQQTADRARRQLQERMRQIGAA